MICSWFDPKTGIGSFFWEQAKFMTPDFNMVLCVFSSTNYGIRNFHKFFTHDIVSTDKAPNGLLVLKFNYPQFAYGNEQTNLNLLKSSLRKFQIYLEEEEIPIDLVHAQSLCSAGIMAQYFYEETGIPFVFTEHDQFNFKSITPTNKKVIDRIFLNDFDKIMVSHDKIRQFFSNRLFADFIVVGNTIDDEIFNYREKNRNDSVFKILTIGAHSPFKDQDTLLKALSILDSTFSGRKIEFIWLGYNGWGKDNTVEVQDLLDKFPFENIEVTSKAKVGRLEIKDYLQDADLFLLTSIAEGMPVSAMEALACGIPVCSTRCGGVDELIDESNGGLFQIKDYSSIGKFIVDFYLDIYKVDNKKISEDFIQKWGKRSFKNKVGEIYNSMIAKHAQK